MDGRCQCQPHYHLNKTLNMCVSTVKGSTDDPIWLARQSTRPNQPNAESCHDDLSSRLWYKRGPSRHTVPDGPQIVLSRSRNPPLVLGSPRGPNAIGKTPRALLWTNSTSTGCAPQAGTQTHQRQVSVTDPIRS
uniref:Uncharacterized protein n=1 Tax=Timema genevievae TaxID=629358 RepID=A0A7R9JZ23_TIMGE|nr:unnamed protein product [Timema genevievae]